MQTNFPVEQSYRSVSGHDYENQIRTMFDIEDRPYVIHPITGKRRTSDGSKMLWGKKVIFEITKSADQTKEDSVQISSELYKKKYPNCLFVVILGRVKSPRKCDGLDSMYDGMTKLIDYVLIGVDEVNEFINSPIQPTNNYKLKLKQSKINLMNNKNPKETSVQLELLNYLIGTENYDGAEKYFKGRISTLNVVDLRNSVKYHNHYNISESMWDEKCKLFDTAIEIDSISNEHTPLWKIIDNLKTSNSIPEVALHKLKDIFNNKRVYKIKSNNKLGYEFYV